MTEVTSVIVFGSTGQTGLQCLKRGIHEGLEVTAFVRRPNAIPQHINSRLFKVMQGDVLDKDRVENAIEGHDAVISALGTGWSLRSTHVMSKGLQNIISGMHKHGIKKIAIVSDVLLLPSFRWNPMRLILWNVHQDHKRQLEVLEKDATRLGLGWIAVMPPMIRNKDKITDYKVAVNALPGGYTVTTADLGDFMVKALVNPRKNEKYHCCKVGISSYSKATVSWTVILVLLLAIAIGVYLYYEGTPTALVEFMDGVMGKYQDNPEYETENFTETENSTETE